MSRQAIDTDELRRIADTLDSLGLRHSATRIRSAIEVAPDEGRIAKVQEATRGATVPMRGIPWGLHEMLWRVYADHGHGEQSAERMVERGGFGRVELGMLAVGMYGGNERAARGHTIPLLDLYREARGDA